MNVSVLTEVEERKSTKRTCCVPDTILIAGNTKMLVKVTPVVLFCVSDVTVATGMLLVSPHLVRDAPREGTTVSTLK